MNRIVEVLGVDLDVEYDYSPYIAATWDDPAEGGEVEITGITLDGTDVLQLLSDWTLEQIQDKLESIDHEGEAREERICAQQEYWASRREDERMAA